MNFMGFAFGQISNLSDPLHNTGELEIAIVFPECGGNVSQDENNTSDHLEQPPLGRLEAFQFGV